MSFDVLVDQLRAAATQHREVAGALGGPVSIGDPTPERLGHVELAAWLGAVRDQCEKAHAALEADTLALGDSLDTAAGHYDTTDQCVAQSFTPRLGPVLGDPFGQGPAWSLPGSVEGR